MATALDLIKAQLRDIGALAVGETPSAEDAQDALAEMNRMLGSWSNEGLMAFERVREEFTLTAGSASRTIGATGNFATTRPLEIVEATIEDQTASPTAEYPVRVLTRSEWALITQKDTQSTIPAQLFYEPTFPNGTLYLFPVPSAAHKLVLYSRKPLTAISALSSTISLPPGWEDALVKNGAIRLSPGYGKEPSALLLQQAIETKAEIKRANNLLNPRLMRCDPGFGGPSRGGDIFRGQ